MKISRRSFARNAIVVATAAAVMPGALAQTTTPPALSSASQAEVDARVQWVVTKYGAHLNEAERADIRRIISGGQSGVETMRKYALENATEPAEPFRIYRKAAKR